MKAERNPLAQQIRIAASSRVPLETGPSPPPAVDQGDHSVGQGVDHPGLDGRAHRDEEEEEEGQGRPLDVLLDDVENAVGPLVLGGRLVLRYRVSCTMSSSAAPITAGTATGIPVMAWVKNR